METTKKKPIHISIDEDLKKDAEQLFAELVMNMTTAITVFLKQSVTKQAIPFKIERGNPATLQARKDAGGLFILHNSSETIKKRKNREKI